MNQAERTRPDGRELAHLATLQISQVLNESPVCSYAILGRSGRAGLERGTDAGRSVARLPGTMSFAPHGTAKMAAPHTEGSRFVTAADARGADWDW